MINLEIALVKAFGWSLRDLDDTDIFSLLPFVFALSGTKGGQVQQTACDVAGGVW